MRLPSCAASRLCRSSPPLEPLNAPAARSMPRQLDGADTDALKDGLNLLTRREGAVCFLCAEQPGGGYSVALGVGQRLSHPCGRRAAQTAPLLRRQGRRPPDSAFGRCARMDLDLVKKNAFRAVIFNEIGT